MYLNLDEIKMIQLDHTSRCNCACPQCARMSPPTQVNPRMPIADLTLDDYKILLEPFSDKQLSEMTLFHCGNFGDAPVSPTFDETVDYCIEKGVGRILISTNGSMRTPAWWSSLAQRGKGRVAAIFSIDGLEDTNHLYRVGANFKKIMENTQAFIDAGAEAQWAFIEFEHNYYQIDEAHALSKQMGFQKFQVKYTARFAGRNQTEITTKKGQVIKDKKDNRNIKERDVIVKEYGSFDNYVARAPISCKFKKMGGLFVDMTMNLWPCCWFGAPPYLDEHNPQRKSFEHFLSLYESDFNSLRKHGWNVLDHEFFSTYLESSWDNPDDRYQRIYTCGRTCGSKFEYSSGYGKNIKEIK